MDTRHYALYGRIGGLTNLVNHGAEKMTRPAREARQSQLRQQAIALGAATEPEIRDKVAQPRRLHAAKMAAARWGKRRKTAKGAGA